MATLLLNRGRINVVKMTLNPFIFIKFILYGKIDTKYEISASELTPPTNFSLIPLKMEKLVKSSTLAPKTNNDVITADQG